MEEPLCKRELGRLSEDSVPLTHRPTAFRRSACSNPALISRLQQSCQLPATGTQFTAKWSLCGTRLLTAGDDCRLRLWENCCWKSSEATHVVDCGHTSSILSANFMPNSCDQVISGSADKQIRHTHLNRGAARPYILHKGRVRAVLPLDSYVILSASEDGTVRDVDVRVKPPAFHRSHELQSASEDYNILVDQRAERIGRSRTKVGINSIAVDQNRPWLILTGGSDPLMRLYDRRMLPLPSDRHGSRSKAPQWVSCYIPAYLKSDLWDSRPSTALHMAGRQSYQLTSVGFARGGSEVVGSYSGHCIYSFDAVEHAHDVESLLHIPESVLRIPTRPRSQGRRSIHQWAPLQQQADAAGNTGNHEARILHPGLSQAGSQQQGPLLHAAHGARQGQAQGTGRAAATPYSGRQRTIAISASLRHLEHLRRQHSQMRQSPPNGTVHAESSHQGHWQQRPSSSTLRSPRRDGYAGPASAVATTAHGGQPPSMLEDTAEGVTQAGAVDIDLALSPSRGQVRRSRRLWQRRRQLPKGDAALPATASIAEDVMAELAGQGEEHPAGDPLELEAMAAGADWQGQISPMQPQPAVSGNVGDFLDVSESEAGEEGGLLGTSTAAAQAVRMSSPTRRRASRRLAAVAAAADAMAPQGHQAVQQDGVGEGECCRAGASTALERTHAEPGVGALSAAGFKHPGGRAAARHGRTPQGLRRDRQPAEQDNVLDAGWADSTLGLLGQDPLQPDNSEVAAAPRSSPPASGQLPGQDPGCRAAGLACNRNPSVAGEGQQLTLQGSAGPRDASPVAAEVCSRPRFSGYSAEAVATRRTAGHEVSSLNSAGDAGLERVDSVAQRPPLEAPSVGNVPHTVATGTPMHRTDGPEASTGHMGPPVPTSVRQLVQQALLRHPTGQDGEAEPPPMEASHGPIRQQPAPPPQGAHTRQQHQQLHARRRQQQQQEGLMRQGEGGGDSPVAHPQIEVTVGHQVGGLQGRRGGGLHPPPQPTASTGTSRPHLIGGTLAAGQGGVGSGHPRLRRTAATSLHQQQHRAEHSCAAGVPQGGSRRGEREASAPHASGANAEAQQAPPAAHTHNLRRHGQELPGSGTQQAQQASSLLAPQTTMLSGRGPSTVGNFLPSSQQAGAESVEGERGALQEEVAQPAPGARGGWAIGPQHAQHGPPNSNVGAILHVADTEGEEVTEPTMYRCCYWGHLNLMGCIDANGVAATPNFEFLGSQSEYLIAPSDDGAVFVWDYATGALTAVLEGDSGEGGVACVATHPHAPMLASGGREPVVTLWSPEAEAGCNLQRAWGVAERNGRALLAADMHPVPQLPPGLALEGGVRGGQQVFRGEDGRQVRCNMM